MLDDYSRVILPQGNGTVMRMTIIYMCNKENIISQHKTLTVTTTVVAFHNKFFIKSARDKMDVKKKVMQSIKLTVAS